MKSQSESKLRYKMEIAKTPNPPYYAVNVGAQNFAYLHSPYNTSTDKPKNQFGPQSKNLASIIRGFKIGVTKNARLINPDFAWQSRFYVHIIRNDESYHRITNYIKNNPKNWKEDKWY